MTDLEGAILVGGRSRRMGRDKSALVLGGRSVVDRIGREMDALVGRIRLVGGTGPVAESRYPRQEDLFPNCGPLGGIHAALATAELPATIVVGCDLPFVTGAFLRGLADRLTEGFEAVVPREGGRPVPVCAIYRTSCLALLEQRLRRGDLAAWDFVRSLRTMWIEGEELKALDPKGLCLKNINTPEDYEEARHIAAAE